jgi:hypothetical protein
VREWRDAVGENGARALDHRDDYSRLHDGAA